MVEAFLIVCFLLAFVCVISKGYIGHRIEELAQRFNDAQHEAQRTATERREIEGMLAFEEDKERRLKVEYEGLAEELVQIKNRLAKRANGPSQG